MEFRVEQEISAPIDVVQAALLDPAFVDRLDRLPKVGKATLVSQEREGNIVEQEVHYVFSGDLSAAVRAVVDPNKISWILESRIDVGDHSSTWRILPDHYGERLTASGTTALVARGDATTRRITQGDVKVHMALVGGRVERAIASGLKEHAEGESLELERFLTGPNG